MQPTDADDADLPTCWAVPLDEPAAPVGQPVREAAESEAEPGMILPFPFRDTEATPEAGFHPRLRRFDEAA